MIISPLKKQINKSPFRGHSPLNKRSGAKNESGLSATLALTPLVDAFAILVIYLLVNTGMSTDLLENEKSIVMPQANQTKILDRGVVVSFKEGSYYIDKEKIKKSQLGQVLAEKLEEASAEIVIHADKKSNYKVLNPILLASAEAGYTKIKFAVLQGSGE